MHHPRGGQPQREPRWSWTPGNGQVSKRAGRQVPARLEKPCEVGKTRWKVEARDRERDEIEVKALIEEEQPAKLSQADREFIRWLIREELRRCP